MNPLLTPLVLDLGGTRQNGSMQTEFHTVLDHAPWPALCFPDVVLIPKFQLVMLAYYRDESSYEPFLNYAGRDRTTVLVTFMGCHGFQALESGDPKTTPQSEIDCPIFAQVKTGSPYLDAYRNVPKNQRHPLKHYRLTFIDFTYDLAAEVCSFELFSCKRWELACMGGVEAHGKIIWPHKT